MSDREQLNEMKKFMKIAEGPEHSRLGQFIKKTKDGVELNIPVNKTFQTKGDGLWSDVAKDVVVTHMSLEVEPDDEEEEGYWARDLGVFYDESTWDNYEDGLIYTDSLFEKQVKKFLTSVGIPNKIVRDTGYSEQGMQEDGRVSLDAYKLGDMVARLAGLNKPITEGDPDDIDWDAHWAREDGDEERADDLEADAEFARMDKEFDEDGRPGFQYENDPDETPYELEYSPELGVYLVIFGKHVIPTGTDDFEEAQHQAVDIYAYYKEV